MSSSSTSSIPTDDAPDPEAVAGAVLCGGASRRMGTDKALLPVDGVPLAERVARTLEAAGCRPVVFVGGDAPRLAALGRPVVADRWPGAGPVGGVLTALGELTGARAVLVAACDLPALTSDAVRAVVAAHVAHRRDAGPSVTIAESDRPEPALGCWSPAAAGEIARRFPAERGLLAIARSLGAASVAVDPAAMRNANRPGDLPGGAAYQDNRLDR